MTIMETLEHIRKILECVGDTYSASDKCFYFFDERGIIRGHLKLVNWESQQWAFEDYRKQISENTYEHIHLGR